MSSVVTEYADLCSQPDDRRNTSRREYSVVMIAPTSFFADYGCHVRILEEALVLRRMGNRVTICTYHNGRDVGNLDIQRTMPIPWRTNYEVGSSRHKMGFDALLLLKTMAVALRVKPDVIHAHLHEGALIGHFVSRLLRAPLVLDFQGSMTSEMIDHRFLNPAGRFYRPALSLEEWIVKLPTAIITSSRHAAGLLTNDFHCPPERITSIPDCVNPGFFAPADSEAASTLRRAQLGIPLKRRVVAYLGLLAEWQGTSLLLQAAAKLIARCPDVHFLIMGFPAVETYRQQAKQLGLANHTTFTGKIPYEQAPSFLALGDVAVAPKISATEGSGKLLNYMAMGMPIVAFDVPVSREYLGNLGVYAQPGDAASLAHALESLLANQEQGQALGRELRKRAVDHYSWNTAGAKIMDIYNRVCMR